MGQKPLQSVHRRALLSFLCLIFTLSLITQPVLAGYGNPSNPTSPDTPTTPPDAVVPPPIVPPEEPEIIEPLEEFDVTVETNTEARIYMDGDYECETEKSWWCLWCDYECEIEGVEEGEHDFKAKADGYETEEESEDISDDETISFDLEEEENIEPVEIDSVDVPDTVDRSETFEIETKIDSVYYEDNGWGKYSVEVEVDVELDGRTFTKTVEDTCSLPVWCYIVGTVKKIGDFFYGYDISVEQEIYSNSAGVKTLEIEARDMNSDTSDYTTETITVNDEFDVTVETNTEARIYMDGDYECETEKSWWCLWCDYTCNIEDVEMGYHDFKAKADGYESDEETKYIDEEGEKVELELKEIFYTLTIETNTPKARIYLDGDYEGKTDSGYPYDLEIQDLKEGEYHVEATKSGYRSDSENVNLDSDEEVALTLKRMPEIEVSGPGEIQAGDCSDFDIKVRYGDGLTVSWVMYSEDYSDYLSDSGSISINSDSETRHARVCIPGSWPEDDYRFEAEVLNEEDSTEFQVERAPVEIESFEVTSVEYTECDVQDDEWVCDTATESNPTEVYGNSEVTLQYSVNNVNYLCNSSGCYSSPQYKIKRKHDFDRNIFGLRSWETHKGSGGDPVTVTEKVAVPRNRSYEEILLEVQDMNDPTTFSYTTDKETAQLKVIPNPEPEITGLVICYSMPDDTGTCEEIVPNKTSTLGNNILSYGPIPRNRGIAVYFRVENLEKNGRSWTYINLEKDKYPELFKEGSELTNGLVVDLDTESEEYLGYVPAIWVIEELEAGVHKFNIRATDLQDADQSDAFTFKLHVDWEEGEISTPFQYGSGEMKEIQEYLYSLQQEKQEYLDLLDSGELSDEFDINATREQIATIDIMMSMVGWRQAGVSSGGALEYTGTLLDQLWSGLKSFGSWLADVGSAIGNAIYNLVTDPIGSLQAVWNWVVEHPFDTIDIAITVLTVTLIVASLIATGGLAGIPLSAMLVLDIATVANIFARAAVTGQALTPIDMITIGLVAVGNVGVLSKGVKNVKLGNMMDDTSALFKQAGKRVNTKLQSVLSRMGKVVGAADGSLDDAARAARSFDDDITRIGKNAFGSAYKKKVANVMKKMNGKLNFLKGVDDEVGAKLLQLADDLDTKTFQKLIARSDFEKYLDDVIRVKNVVGTKAASHLIDLPWNVRGISRLADDQVRSAWRVLSENQELLARAHKSMPESWIGRKINFVTSGIENSPMKVKPNGLVINIDRMPDIERFGDIFLSHEFGHVSHLGPLEWPPTGSPSAFGIDNAYMKVPDLGNLDGKVAEQLIADKVGILRNSDKSKLFSEWVDNSLSSIERGLKSTSSNDRLLAFNRALRYRTSMSQADKTVASSIDNIIERAANNAMQAQYDVLIREYNDFINGVVIKI